MANQNKLKAWVRYDGTGRVVTGGPIFQAKKPKVGNWRQMNASLCCNGSTPSSTTTSTTTVQPGPTLYGIIANLSNDFNAACGGTGGFVNFTIYSTTPSINYGSLLYLDAAGTQPYSSGTWGEFVKPIGEDYAYNVSGNTVTNFGNLCPQPVESYRLGTTGYGTSEQACTNGLGDLGVGYTVYSAGPAFQVPAQLYTDAGLTTPLTLGTLGRYPIMQGYPSGTLRSAYIDTSGMMYNAFPC